MYAYVGNNPVMSVDPLGLCGLQEDYVATAALGVAATAVVYGAAAVIGTGQTIAASLWPAAAGGRQVINGIEYTVHALERMAPVGTIQNGSEMVSRGVPISVVENAINFVTKMSGNTANEIVHIFENVKVVTNHQATRVITVITTGR